MWPAPAPAWRRRPAPHGSARDGQAPATTAPAPATAVARSTIQRAARRCSPLRQQLERRCRLRAFRLRAGGGNLDPAVPALLAFLHHREIDRLAGFELVGERAREHELVVIAIGELAAGRR